MIAVALASLAKMPACANVPARRALRGAGRDDGNRVTPDTIARIGEWPFTMALLGLTMIAVMGRPISISAGSRAGTGKPPISRRYPAHSPW
ncbi:MAG: hypothetical protein HPM95_04620 [Alphaproteobacteria bacterium]|nr:hypothetical protein [Alphaproteobacteria bacterium]